MREPQRPQPVDHRGVECFAVAATLVVRVNKKCPDIPGLVARRESANLCIQLNDPGTARVFLCSEIVRDGDATWIGQRVLAHGQAHALHARDIVLCCSSHVHFKSALSENWASVAKIRYRMEPTESGNEFADEVGFVCTFHHL